MRTFARGTLAVLFLSAAALPALAASTTGSGSVTIIRLISVTENTNLVFGTIIAPASGGSVTIDTLGARSFAGGAAAAGSSVGVGNADFTVSGEGGQAITVSVDSSITLTGPSAATLSVSTTATHTGSQTLSNSLGSAGTLDVAVGGSISGIGSTTTSGAYTGTFNVSANYN